MLAQSHILIAGCTGSGKSTLVNGMVYTALVNSPAIVQFVFIDPKKVELYKYKDIPHCISYADNT